MTRAGREYRPFPEKTSRNERQENLEVPLFVRLLGLTRRARILEVGCGAGVALPALHQLCSPEVLVGLDIDPVTLRSAAARTSSLQPAVELIQGDVRSIPLPDDFFDAVVDFGTCYHIARGDDAGREIERVLKVGGVFATETKLNQFLSHPVRSHGRTLPLNGTTLRIHRHAGLWLSYVKAGQFSEIGTHRHRWRERDIQAIW